MATIFFAPLEEREFKLLQALIYDKAGIRLQDHKKALVENRLRKRLRELGLDNYGDYYRYLTSPAGVKDELSNFLDAITTNETYFFRHTPLWKYLMNTWFPAIAQEKQRTGGTINIWSAASSTGEEPFSIAMAALESIPKFPKTRIRIVASDLSQHVLRVAQAGVYRPYAVSRMPKEYLAKYFAKGIDKTQSEERYQLSREVTSMVQFRNHNLKNPPAVNNCDLILLRNVMIYFDGPTKDLVLRNIIRGLVQGGIVCVGEAESLTNLVDGFMYVQPSIFKQCTAADLESGVPRSRLTSNRLLKQKTIAEK